MSRISETSLQMELGLQVSDLSAAVRFYTTLLGMPPVRHWPELARFEVDEPPLVLVLRAGPDGHAGALNHVGFRLEDSAPLVALQHRLELAGYTTEREDGVECCYSRQTKFWIADPDGNLWEIYALDDEAADGAAAPSSPAGDSLPSVWGYRGGDPLPFPVADNVLDELHLDGPLTVSPDPERNAVVLLESYRVLKTGGTLAVRCELFGLGQIASLLHRLEQAGFQGARVDRWQPRTTADPAEPGLLTASAVKPGAAADGAADWMSCGPAREVEPGSGQVLIRGVRQPALSPTTQTGWGNQIAVLPISQPEPDRV